jgi:hypothetical protein
MNSTLMFWLSQEAVAVELAHMEAAAEQAAWF